MKRCYFGHQQNEIWRTENGHCIFTTKTLSLAAVAPWCLSFERHTIVVPLLLLVASETVPASDNS